MNITPQEAKVQSYNNVHDIQRQLPEKEEQIISQKELKMIKFVQNEEGKWWKQINKAVAYSIQEGDTKTSLAVEDIAPSGKIDFCNDEFLDALEYELVRNGWKVRWETEVQGWFACYMDVKTALIIEWS